MQSNQTKQDDDYCPVLYKIQDKLLSQVKYDEETDECLNPEAFKTLQNELGLHIKNCSNSECQKSFEARVRVGLQDKEGNYLVRNI